MKNNSIISSLILSFICVSATSQTTYYVNDNSTLGDTWCSAVGNDGNNGTSASTPKATLAAALALAGSNDIIRVDKGTYTDDLLDMTSTHDGVLITGAGRDATIFDQSGTGDHFMEIKSSATNITISDMTIKDYDEGDNGGAIDITSGGSSITLEDINFDNNKATASQAHGGAVYISSSSTVTLNRCSFTNNQVQGNNSSTHGSSIYSEGTVTIQNCLFYDNICTYTADNGHVHIENGTATIVNCKLVYFPISL